MNHRQLEMFRAIMLTGSTSRAAELLQVSQPAVSRALAELERSVNFQLFARIRSRLVPTEEGKLLLAEIQRSFVGLDRIRAQAARIRDFGSGSVRVASLAAMGSTLVPRAIGAFQQKYSDIAVTLQIHASALVRDLVADGGFDIGLAADAADLIGVDHRVFSSVRAVCVLPPGHPLALKEVLGPEDLHDQAFIALSTEDRTRRRFEAAMRAAQYWPRIVVETPGSATICSLALQGVGIGLVHPVATDGYAERGVIFKTFEPAIHFRTMLLFRPDAQKSILVKNFVAELYEARNRNYAR